MTSHELLEILESNVAPISLSDEFCAKEHAYDNSGIIIDNGKQIMGIMFSLDFSLATVAEAKKKGFNCIVTHHPAIYGGINRIDVCNDSQAAAIAECLLGGFTVISMHLNFDAAQEGIDYYLMRGIGGQRSLKNLVELSCGSYGRLYDIEHTTLYELCQKLKKNFSSDRVVYYGPKDKNIDRACSFCGAGCDDGAVKFALQNKADVLISSDLKHHHIAALVSAGVGVIALTHYASETFGFKKIYEKLTSKLSAPTSFFCDQSLI